MEESAKSTFHKSSSSSDSSIHNSYDEKQSESDSSSDSGRENPIITKRGYSQTITSTPKKSPYISNSKIRFQAKKTSPYRKIQEACKTLKKKKRNTNKANIETNIEVIKTLTVQILNEKEKLQRQIKDFEIKLQKTEADHLNTQKEYKALVEQKDEIIATKDSLIKDLERKIQEHEKLEIDKKQVAKKARATLEKYKLKTHL